MRINHNISAQLANVNLKKTNNKMSSTLESLSSGYKINKAADDSAGLAISNKMRSQIRALDQASRNAGDGESLLQTAEGSLSEIQSMVQRMRELSVQAANDTNTISDRAAMQEEIDALLDEVDRIAETTEFNGKGLLDGSSGRAVTINKNGLDAKYFSDSVTAGTYEITVTTVAESATANLSYTVGTASSFSINGTSIEIGASDTSEEVFDKIVSVCSDLGIDVDGNATSQSMTLTTKAKGSAQQIEIDKDGATQTSKGVDAVVSAGSGFSTGTVCRGNGESVVLRDNSGFEMQLSVNGASVDTTAEIVVYDAGAMTLQIGANESQDLAIDLQEISCATLNFRQEDGVDMVNVCSQNGATNAIDTFDNALEMISTYRSQLGAYTNRLESTEASLDVTSENMTEAMSRITDTDMATAMTEYTQQDVLVQAATSMLAQANNRPQTVMSLLQG